MKSDKAEDYLIKHECRYPMDGYVPLERAAQACEIAEEEAEERVRAELTRWHDPQEELPQNSELVIIKYSRRGHISYALAYWWKHPNCREKVWRIDCMNYIINPLSVIGWCEIHE